MIAMIVFLEINIMWQSAEGKINLDAERFLKQFSQGNIPVADLETLNLTVVKRNALKFLKRTYTYLKALIRRK